MAEGTGDRGIKSDKQPYRISNKPHHNNATVNFINKISKKDSDKKQGKTATLQDPESPSNASPQRSKHNQEDKNECVKNKKLGKNASFTPERGSSSNTSPHRSKQKHDNKKEHTKSNFESSNGSDKIAPNNTKSSQKSKQNNKKVTSKSEKADNKNSKREAEEMDDLQQSFQDLVLVGKHQKSNVNVKNKKNNESRQNDGKGEAKDNSKKPHKGKDKEKNKEVENALRRELELARHKFWMNYFQKHPSELVVLSFHKMNELQKVDLKQQHAQFKCGVCQYYCNSMAVVSKHIKEDRHNKNILTLLENNTVKAIPSLPASCTDVQTEILENIYAQYGMTKSDCAVRVEIINYIDTIVKKELPGCSVRMFGSSVHGLGLKESDLNIDLRVSQNYSPARALCVVAELIGKSAGFCSVKTNFTEKIPSVVFVHEESKVECVISLNNERPILLSALLAKYTDFHPMLPKLTTVFRLWGKLARVDKQDRGLWPAYALYLLVIYYLQQCPDPILPILNDFVSEAASENPSQSDSNESVLHLDINEVKKHWKTKNKQSLGELWVDLLKFYASNCDSPNYIVSIDGSEAKFRQPKRINIVDPFMPKRNVTRTVTSTSLYSYIAHCLKSTYKYFGLPQTRQGPIFGNIVEELMPPEKYMHHKDVFTAQNSMTSQLIRLIPLIDKNYMLNDITEEEAYQKVSQVLRENHQNYINLFNISVRITERSYPSDGQYKKLIVSPRDAMYLVEQLDTTVLQYKFNGDKFTSGMAVPLVCEVCKEEGHFKDNCPTENLSELEPLPPVDKKMLFCLDAVCAEVFDKWRPDQRELCRRDEIVHFLQKFISSLYPSAVLTLFGSSKNGFGARRSDLDICLTFSDEDARKGLKAPAFIEKLGGQLKKCPALKNLLTISSAKVPIIKFEHIDSRLEGDISLYNILGQENTQLLRSYTDIDSRVTPLGYMMKKFAKQCHIGDASKGGLSSYAYNLMVIYFLQHCSPPILPVLQELHEGDGPCPEVFIDGCNTYYFKNLAKLNEVWQDRQENTMSVGYLWLQLLRFYTETFDIENNVISIRTSKPVTKFDKLWISKCIAIEDPFDVAHNLGSALTRNMNVFIIKALRKGRKTFGSPIQQLPSSHSIQNLYFNTTEFPGSIPPNDRGCRFCKIIGHVVRDCPTKKANTKKKHSQKKLKENKENAVSSEDSKDAENNFDISESDSECEKGSEESGQETMTPTKNTKNTDESVTTSSAHLKLSKRRLETWERSRLVGVPFVSSSLAMVNSLPPQDAPLSLVKRVTPRPSATVVSTPGASGITSHTASSQNVPGASSSGNYYDSTMGHVYRLPYQNILPTPQVRNSPTPGGNHYTSNVLPSQAKPMNGNNITEVPSTLIYTNTNYKNEPHPASLLPVTQIPNSLVYTNTNYKNELRGACGPSMSPTERDLNHDMLGPLSGILTPQYPPPLPYGQAKPEYSPSMMLPPLPYENLGHSAPLIPPVMPTSIPPSSPSVNCPGYVSSVSNNFGHQMVSPPFDYKQSFFNPMLNTQLVPSMTVNDYNSGRMLPSPNIHENYTHALSSNRIGVSNAGLYQQTSASTSDLSSPTEPYRLAVSQMQQNTNSVPSTPDKITKYKKPAKKTKKELSELDHLNRTAEQLFKSPEEMVRLNQCMVGSSGTPQFLTNLSNTATPSSLLSDNYLHNQGYQKPGPEKKPTRPKRQYNKRAKKQALPNDIGTSTEEASDV